MARGMGYKIGFEGETEFMNAVKQMNAQLRTLQTEMQAVTSAFDREDQSQEKLIAQSRVLTRQIALQEQRVEAQRRLLDEARAAYDENSIVVQRYAQQMNRAVADLNNMNRALRQNENALEQMGNSAEDAGDGLDNLDGEMEGGSRQADVFASVLGGSLAAKGLEVVASAAVDATKKIAEFSAEADKALSMVQAQLGLTEEEAESYGSIVTAVYAKGFAESMEEAAEVVAKVGQQMRGLPEDKMRTIADNALILQKIFDIDIQEGLRGVDAMVKQFGINADEAFDLVVAGAQRGLNQNGDLADQIAEYSVYYADAGFSAQQMFSMMASGAENGVFQIDYLNDAIKEFGIRTKDNSDSSKEAFQTLGLDANKMFEMFAAGGEQAQTASQLVNEALFAMDDKVKQNEIGVSLYGTKWEDVGIRAVQAMTNAQSEFANVDGAAQAAGEAMVSNFSDQMRILQQEVAAAVFEVTNGTLEPEQFREKMTEIITRMSDAITENAPMLLDKGFELVEGFGGALADAAPELVPDAVKLVVAIVETLLEHIPDVIMVAPEIVGGLVSGLISAIPDLIMAVPQLMVALVTAFDDMIDNFDEVGRDIAMGIWNGIKEGWNKLKDGFKNLINNLLKVPQDELDINSPSRKFRDEVGVQITAGIAEGIIAGKGKTEKAVADVSKDLLKSAEGIGGMLPFARSTAQKVGDVLEKEAKALNGRLAEIQNQAAAEQAEAERKQYEESIAEKYKELEKAEKAGKQKLLDEIAKLESDWNRKQEETALKDRIAALQEFQKEYESAIAEIEKSQGSLQSKLAGYGSLFERVKTEEGKDLFQLGDIESEIRKLEEYGDAIERLRGRGISDSLVGEIAGMGVDDALAYMDKLISLSDAKFEQYVSLFEKKQQTAQGVAEKFYQGEFDALEQNYAQRLPEALDGVKAQMYEAGEQAAESLKEGLQADGEGMGQAVTQAVSAAVTGANEDTQEQNFLTITQGMAEQEPILTEYIEGLKERLIALIESFRGEFTDVGEMMMEGVAQGIRNGESGVVNAVASVIAAAVKKAKSDLDINSPSKVFAEIGGYMAAGLDTGWTEKMQDINRSISNSLAGIASPPGMAESAGAAGGRNYTYGDINVHVDTVNNANGRDVQTLATELEFFRRQQSAARGG